MKPGKWVRVKVYCDEMGVGEKTARLMVKRGQLAKKMISPRMYVVWLPDDRVLELEGSAEVPLSVRKEESEQDTNTERDKGAEKGTKETAVTKVPTPIVVSKEQLTAHESRVAELRLREEELTLEKKVKVLEAEVEGIVGEEEIVAFKKQMDNADAREGDLITRERDLAVEWGELRVAQDYVAGYRDKLTKFNGGLQGWCQELVDAIGRIDALLDELVAGSKLDPNGGDAGDYLYPDKVKQHWVEIARLLGVIRKLPGWLIEREIPKAKDDDNDYEEDVDDHNTSSAFDEDEGEDDGEGEGDEGEDEEENNG